MKKTKQNNLQLVISLKKGDESVFKVIYDTNIKALTAFINSYTKNQPETKDIVQDAFIKLWTARNALDENKSIVNFLYTTAYNGFIDKYRKNKREQTMLDGWLYKRLVLWANEDEDVKLRKIILVKIAIEKLPTKCKEIFILSKFEQLKYSEIANKLDISIKTVENQMGKAFSIIRKEVKEKNILNLFLCFMKKLYVVK